MMRRMTRRWYDYQGGLVELADDVPLTMYDGLNHRIRMWEGEHVGQMLTGCGKRACPGLTRQVPGRGDVDCPECMEADRG